MGKLGMVGVVVLLTLGCAQNNGNSTSQISAFPGAEGFGAQATGGRGGRVVYVTNLEASGPGSLQWALDQDGPRTVLFKLGGVIRSVVTLRKGNVTIAGQTAPGGITVQGLLIEGDVVCEEDRDACVPRSAPENFVVRFIRSRSPAENSGGDGVRLHRAKRGILDHLSIGNATDEAMQISLSSDITVQHVLLAETLGEHADLGGMLINYSDPSRNYPLTRLSIIKNTFNRINGRIPEITRENFPSAKNSVMELEYSHNLIYDPKAPIWLGLTCLTNSPGGGYSDCPIEYRLNMVGNFIFGRVDRFSFGFMTLEGGLSPDQGYLPAFSPTRVFMSQNRINRYPNLRDYQLIYCCNDMDQAVQDNTVPFASRSPSFAQASRHNFPPIAVVPEGEGLLEYMVNNVGVFPRDAMDSRLMGFVQRKQFDSRPTERNPVNDALITLPSAASPSDNDADGMPDVWETDHKLNPNLPNANSTVLGNTPNNGIMGCSPGYTDLECYLNQLAYLKVNNP